MADPQAKVIKLRSQEGLEIRGVDGRDEIVADHLLLKGRSVGMV